MTRGKAKKEAELAERKCIATGQSGPKAGLIRFVVGPDAQIVPDLAEKLPGRGIWVAADRAALERAVAKKLFSRAAGQQVTVADDLVETVTRLLTERAISLISLARKAGLAIAGKEKVKAALASDDAVVLIQASDGSAREKTGLRPPDGENTQFEGLLAAELGLAFGRDRVIHAALMAGGLTKRVRYEMTRLGGLRRATGG